MILNLFPQTILSVYQSALRMFAGATIGMGYDAVVGMGLSLSHLRIFAGATMGMGRDATVGFRTLREGMAGFGHTIIIIFVISKV